MNTQITSIGQLKGYSAGQVVEFPPFAEGQPLIARIKRPSMLLMAKSGKIPNALLGAATDLFSGQGTGNRKGKEKETALKEVFGILDVICEGCFLEPSWNDMKEAGVELTDEQYMFVFKYAQQGVKALEPFRNQSANHQSAEPVEAV